MSPSVANFPEPIQVFCNGVPEAYSKKRKCKKLSVEYRHNQQIPPNVQLHLPEFILSVTHLPDRILDLLEIAAYIFCADRHNSRGDRESVEYHSWARTFEFFIKVRDSVFWSDPNVKQCLSDALIWMTGDRAYHFTFLPGHSTGKAHLYDSDKLSPKQAGTPRVVLFSGGLDSLAGVIDLLETTQDTVWPISHNSGNPGTIRTLKQLIRAITPLYPDRVKHKILKCHLHKVRAPEESQRTRAFLYCSMALGMATSLNQSEFYVFENGVTALNFRKRYGMLNARASRTAHPKTLNLLQDLFSLILGKEVKIKTPFAFKTKTEIIEVLKGHERLHLMNSSVSCSKTFKQLGMATHCGVCSQCIDRRFAAYASGTNDEDEGGIYAFDFIHEEILDGETKTFITDFLRQAYEFLHSNDGYFYNTFLDQLSNAINTNADEQQQFEQIYSLCQRHGKNIEYAIQKMIRPLESYPQGSLKTIVYGTDFSRPPIFSLAQQIADGFSLFISKAFSKEKPKNENDLNAKLDGYLSGHKEKFQREHPFISFATSQTVPDHSNENLDLLIEAKYIRGATTPGVATKGIAEDLTKYPDDTLKLFIVYDPERTIIEREVFKSDFEKKRYCLIHIV